MASKKYDEALIARVEKLRDGLEPQPLNALWQVDTSLRNNHAKLRRILSRKAFPGDEPDIRKMEEAKALLLSVRHG